MQGDEGSAGGVPRLSGRRTALLAAAGAVMLTAAGLAARRLVIPRERPLEARDLADLDSEFVQVNGLRVHVKRAGEGPPTLVLLHGFAASTFSWREVMAPLAEHAAVIAYDRPSFGLTDRPLPGEWLPDAWPGGTPYGPEAQVGILIGLLDQFGVDKAVLVGNSMGGAVAALVAARRPERVQALVLVDAYLESAGPSAAFGKVIRSAVGRRIGPSLLSPFSAGFGAGLRRLVADPAVVTNEMVQGYARPLRLPRAKQALWELTAAGSVAVSEAELRSIAVPTLVLRGEADLLVKAAAAERSAAFIPGAILRTIPGAGHMPQEEQPTLFVQAIEKFLRAVSLKRAE